MAPLVMRSNSECYFVLTYKIWAKSFNPGRSYGYVSNRRWRPSAILVF